MALRLLALAACLTLTARTSTAQSPYSGLVGLGLGAVPGEQRHPSVAGSVGLFRRMGSAIDLGFEVGYQRFGARREFYDIGGCPILPAGECVGQVTADRRQSGDLWFVGPTVRLHAPSRGTVRPFLLTGIGAYGSGEHTTVTYRDAREVTVPVPGPLVFERTFGGVGVNGAVGVEGGKPGALGWMVMARVHGAVGGMGAEMASIAAWTVTAGMVLQ
jgi:hypothetical protein